jgi:hypothetical protein
MTEAMPCKELETEVNDLHFRPSNDGIMVVTTFKCQFLDIIKGKVLWSLDKLSIGSIHCQFRSARYAVFF